MVSLSAWSLRFQSLSGRLVLVTVFIQLLLLPVLFSGIVTVLEKSAKDEFVNQIRLTAGMLASVVETEFAAGNQSAIGRLFDDSMLGGQVIYADLVTNDTGTIRGELFNALTPTTFHEDIAFGNNQDDTYFLAIPIHSDKAIPVASLRLGFDETQTRVQMVSAYWKTGGLIAGYLLLNIVTITMLGRRMTRPLHQLRAASRSIAAGDLTEKLTIASELSDVQELSDDLECMRQTLVDQATRLEFQALHDGLTGLPNRTLLMERLQQAIRISHREPVPLALFLMDIDHFKEVNDTLGHQVGDTVLTEVGKRFAAVMRAVDTVARLGGDEFAILVHNADTNMADIVAAKIMQVLEPPIPVDGYSLRVRISTGVAVYPADGDEVATLLRRADVAMYEAKRNRSAYQFYHTDLDRHSLYQLTLRNDLSKALTDDELVMYYQPKVSLADGSVEGVEALVRWQHPERGVIAPDQFIPLAEHTGLINTLTRQVLHKSLDACRQWREKGWNLTVAVNLSPRNLMDAQLVGCIEDTLHILQIPPALLELELTESALLDDPARAAGILTTLHNMGVRIAIDDFGTGYSSLAYLKQLPVSEIKIDKSFVMDMESDTNNAAIVRATIAMARDLGLSVIAEGVENSRTQEMLQDLGCDRAQGYYYSAPVAQARFEGWYAEQLSASHSGDGEAARINIGWNAE